MVGMLLRPWLKWGFGCCCLAIVRKGWTGSGFMVSGLDMDKRGSRGERMLIYFTAHSRLPSEVNGERLKLVPEGRSQIHAWL